MQIVVQLYSSNGNSSKHTAMYEYTCVTEKCELFKWIVDTDI